MRTILLAAILLAACIAMPGAAAEPEPPECYDRGPVIDGVVVQVWLTRGCDPYLVIDETPLCNDLFCT